MSSAIDDFLTPALAYRPGADSGQALAGILGALMGDALGVPHEFKRAEHIPPARDIRLIMPADYPKTYPGIPYGTWSDDGSQLLCLLDSLDRSWGTLNLKDFSRQLLTWHAMGWHQSGGQVFDCGTQTRDALLRLEEGVDPLEAGTDEVIRHLGARGERNGNGALMRVLPAALAPSLWTTHIGEAIDIALQQSRVTHGHALSIVTCGLYTQMAILVIAQAGFGANDWRELAGFAAERLRSHPAMTTNYLAALESIMAFDQREMPTGSGFVIDTFWSAVLALNAGTDYLSAVRSAVSLGGDTDTTACVTGGLAALAWGLESVPPAWWGQLKFPAETTALLSHL